MNQSRLWTIGAILVIVALIGGTWLIGISPRLAEASVADSGLQAAEVTNNAHRQTLVALQEEAQNLDDVVAELDELQQVIPENLEVSSFIAAIQKLALQTGVNITALALSEPIVYVPPVFDDQALAASADTAAANGLYVIPINLIAKGATPALFDFTEALQRGKRFTLVHGIAVAPDGDGSGEVTIQGQLFGLTGLPPVAPVDPNAPKP